eukprot:evm.model.scf_1745.2 EVM.evm.TU.scf_1745.2   scf_1745:21469-22497(+)
MLPFLGARFPHPELEARYRDFLAREGHLRQDATFGALRTAILLAVASRSASLNGATSPSTVGVLALLASALGQALLGAWAARRGCDASSMATYRAVRTAMSVFTVGLLIPVASRYWYSDWFPAPEEGSSAIALLAFYVVGSGIPFLFIVSLAGSLALEQQMGLQAASVALMVRMRAPGFCGVACGIPSGRDVALDAWRWLEMASQPLLEAMYWREVPLRAPPGSQDACFHVLSQAYVVVCLLGVTYLVWLAEARSREEFLKRHRGAGGGVHLMREGLDSVKGQWWGHVGVKRMAGHAAMAAVFCAVWWRVVTRDVGWGPGGGEEGWEELEDVGIAECGPTKS